MFRVRRGMCQEIVVFFFPLSSSLSFCPRASLMEEHGSDVRHCEFAVGGLSPG